MKRYLFLAVLFSLTLPVSIALADEIKTGNASAETRVYNTVSDDGDTYTHIETTVNGKTNIIESKNEGEIDVRNVNGKVTINKSPEVMVTITQDENSTATPTITKKQQLKTPSLFAVIVKGIEDLF